MLNRRFLRIRVIQALYAQQKNEIHIASAEKNLATSLLRSYELYALMLRLVVDVRRVAEERIEIGKNKKLPTRQELHPNTQFIDNEVIEQLAASESLNAMLALHKLSWNRDAELVKHIYTRMTESDYYTRYMERVPKYVDDLRVVMDFYRHTVLDNDLLEEVVEGRFTGWYDAVEYAVVSVTKSLEHLHGGEEFTIDEQYAGEDDAQFAKKLFIDASIGWADYYTYIEKFADNWDADRLASLDTIIIIAAITELINFPSIPVKVTMDEYIDIAKFYSTPTSGNFINGVLNRVVEALREEEKINKSGRGLIE